MEKFREWVFEAVEYINNTACYHKIHMSDQMVFGVITAGIKLGSWLLVPVCVDSSWAELSVQERAQRIMRHIVSVAGDVLHVADLMNDDLTQYIETTTH